MNFNKDLSRMFRVWLPPLLVIPAMLLAGFWSEVAYYFLFTHHLFWIIGGILLINPAIEILWPPQPTAKAARPQKHRLNVWLACDNKRRPWIEKLSN